MGDEVKKRIKRGIADDLAGTKVELDLIGLEETAVDRHLGTNVDAPPDPFDLPPREDVFHPRWHFRGDSVNDVHRRPTRLPDGIDHGLPILGRRVGHENVEQRAVVLRPDLLKLLQWRRSHAGIIIDAANGWEAVPAWACVSE